jgi:hypothetical protein
VNDGNEDSEMYVFALISKHPFVFSVLGRIGPFLPLWYRRVRKNILMRKHQLTWNFGTLLCYGGALVSCTELIPRQLDIDGGMSSRLSGYVFVLETFLVVSAENLSFLWVPLLFAIERLQVGRAKTVSHVFSMAKTTIQIRPLVRLTLWFGKALST